MPDRSETSRPDHGAAHARQRDVRRQRDADVLHQRQALDGNADAGRVRQDHRAAAGRQSKLHQCFSGNISAMARQMPAHFGVLALALGLSGVRRPTACRRRPALSKDGSAAGAPIRRSAPTRRKKCRTPFGDPARKTGDGPRSHRKADTCRHFRAKPNAGNGVGPPRRAGDDRAVRVADLPALQATSTKSRFPS